ncbi:uncharacterized protein LOC141904946 isoform X2 [Tubulanus polymorphus]|uniref:uncharacterized protein LOC141904946 isoform X2 n=1 Tax=Tubulanus polymorphus TaxID=672921 RepID=UPI003DA4FA48
MKEISQQGHTAAAVATESTTCQIPSLSSNLTADGQGFDDDDNEGWELGVGDLIIDLDADLERNNTSPISDPSPATKMSSFEHQATVVDKGLKMKIKRKSGGKSSDTNKHEIVKNDSKLANINEANAGADNPAAAGAAPNTKTKTSPAEAREKTVKGRGAHKKDKNAKDKAKSAAAAAAAGASNNTTDNNSTSGTFANGFPNNYGSNNSNSDSTNNQTSVDGDGNKLTTAAGIKREVTSDPYEFNAKVEDRITMPLKKIKVEKPDNTANSSGSSISAPSVDASTATSHVGTITEPECLGACEPGTSVCLEGIVWQETENGVLVVNVTWRGKTYVGTLLDATKHDWAPPRFSCDSPTSDIDARTPKRGGKRGARGSVSSTPVTETSLETRKLRKGRRGNGTIAPPSPAKSDITSSGIKRKGRPVDLDINPEDIKSAKRYRSNSRGTPTGISSLATSELSEPALIECPEPNCNKKYRHINGLRYHQSHAHTANSSNNSEDKDKENSSEDSRPSTPTDSVSSDSKTTGRRTPKSKDTTDKTKANQTKVDITESKTSKDSGSDSKSSTSSSAKDSINEKSDSVATVAKTNTETIATVSSTNSATPVTSSQVYQITSANVTRIGNLTVVQKPMDATTTHVIGQSTATTITAVTVPITTVATIPAHIIGEKDDKKKKGESKGKSSKTVAQRPIVPATAMPQVITLTTGPLTHSTMAAPQISPTSNLKPIQPKPTSMTEPSTVNPVLAGLQKEKKAKKKKKDKGDRDAQKSSDNRDTKTTDNNKDDHTAVKCEPKSVIKANPSLSSNKAAESSDNRSKSVLKQKSESTTANTPSSVDAHQQQSRGSVPPASLNLSSPIAGPQQSEVAEPGSENVQSPAYSDISDANESAPQLDSENEGKTAKENPKCTQPESMNTPERNADTSMKQYGMYSYYGQPPYLIPTVSKTQSNTPATTPPGVSAGNDAKKTGKSIDSSSQPIDATKSTANAEKGAASIGAKDDNGLIKNIKKEVVSNYPESQDYQQQQQQQKIQQQQQQQQQPQMYGRAITHPQFSYMGAYGYAMDPAYHMHLMATDPHYKQQHELYMEEQERIRREQMGAGGKSSPNAPECKTPNKPTTGTEPVKLDDRLSRTGSPKNLPIVDQNKNDPKLLESKIGSEKDYDQPMNLKSGASDSGKKVVTAKETIRIKTEPKDVIDPNVVQQEKLREKHQEELQRYYMYQQQKLMEQHRAEDIRKRGHSEHDRQKSEHSRSDHKQQRDLQHSESLKSEKSSHKDSGQRPGKVPTPHDSTKQREAMERSRDSSGSRDGSTKHREDANKFPPPHHRIDDKRGSPAMTSKHKDMTPVGHSGANMVQGAYPGYMGHPYPHYAAQLHYDPNPNHPMYRGLAPMMGYPGHPYMHPAQIRYMSPVDHPDKDKIPPIPSAAGHPVGQPPPGVIGEQPKALDLLQQHASYYASQQHKIHELEKVKPDSRMSPKMAEGSPMSNKSKSEYTNSPPPQRHLHTHHHTHLMGGYPPGAIYDPYGAIIASQQAAAAAAAGIPPHPYAGK